MKQLMCSDIYSWSIFSEMRQIDFNGHLWVRPEGNILIDPVPMIDSDLNQLVALGGVELIVITNCDHEREAEEFREITGAQIAIHEADAGALSTKVDRLLADQEEDYARFNGDSSEVRKKRRRNRTLLLRTGNRARRGFDCRCTNGKSIFAGGR